MQSIGLLRKGNFTQKFSPDSDLKDQISKRVTDKRSVDALIWLLHEKRHAQEGKIDKNIFAIQAQTGAGKSTLMISELYKHLVSSKGTIICTQPRVLLAQRNASSLSSFEKTLLLGKNVGYITRPMTVLPSEHHAIIYATTRTVSNLMSKHSPEVFGQRYPVIVIDEAHDGSIEMLLLLKDVKGYLKDYHNKAWCPMFIISSATIYPPHFIKYLGGEPLSPYNTGHVSGHTNFPVETIYTVEKDMNLINNAYGCILKALEMNKQQSSSTRDILTIMKGPKEISSITTMLYAHLEKEAPTYMAIDVAENVSPPENARKANWYTIVPLASIDVIERTGNYLITGRKNLERETRIYVTTPITEAGLTLPALRHVIDGGWRLIPMPMPLYGITALIPVPITRSNLEQRKGRVGRKSEGVFWPLYTEKTANTLAPMDYPPTVKSKKYVMDLLDILINSTMKQYGAFYDSVFATGTLIAMEKTKRILPPIDLLKDIDLLSPIPFDMITVAFRELYRNRLLMRDGRLTIEGLQFGLINAKNIGEMRMRLVLMDRLIHVFDINLLCEILSDALLEYSVHATLSEEDIFKKYYLIPPQKTSYPSVTVFEDLQGVLERISAGIDPMQYMKRKNMNVATSMLAVHRSMTLDAIRTTTLIPYADSDIPRKSRIRMICQEAISELKIDDDLSIDVIT